MQMSELVPKGVFLTRGVGIHKERLNAFSLALRDARIEKLNLVSVSNVLPPGCKLLTSDEGVAELHDGQIAFCVMARQESDQPGQLLAASVGMAVPGSRKAHGIVAEHQSFEETEEEAQRSAEQLAISRLASTLGVDFDPQRDFDPRKQGFRISDSVVKSQTTVQSARAHKSGKWTCCVAAAVFVF